MLTSGSFVGSVRARGEVGGWDSGLRPWMGQP